jgi:hypothetical protein
VGVVEIFRAHYARITQSQNGLTKQNLLPPGLLYGASPHQFFKNCYVVYEWLTLLLGMVL